jgi:hypothetical protein
MTKANLTPAKLCLILVVLAMIGLTSFGIVDAKDFVALAMLIAGFYFGQPTNTSDVSGMGK